MRLSEAILLGDSLRERGAFERVWRVRNSHYQLLSALKGLREAAIETGSSALSSVLADAVRTAEQAISAAEEGL